MKDEQQETDDMFDRLFASPVIPKFWTNGVVVGNSPSEATIVFLQGKVAVATISMGFSALKTLHDTIGTTLKNIETTFSSEVKSIEELRQNYQEKIKTE